MSKYELTYKARFNRHGVTLYRIRALRSIPRHGVEEGDLGGWIESEENLSHDGDSWVSGGASVFGDAFIFDDALVYGESLVFGNAMIYGSAQTYGNAMIYGSSRVFGHAQVFDKAHVFGEARVSGLAWVYGDALVFGEADVLDEARVLQNIHFLTAKIFTTQPLNATAFLQQDGSWRVRVGCWYGSVPELRSLAESDRWVETPPEDIEEARPELLAFVALCETRAARTVL